jgi:hypothetical protein
MKIFVFPSLFFTFSFPINSLLVFPIPNGKEIFHPPYMEEMLLVLPISIPFLESIHTTLETAPNPESENPKKRRQ